MLCCKTAPVCKIGLGFARIGLRRVGRFENRLLMTGRKLGESWLLIDTNLTLPDPSEEAWRDKGDESEVAITGRYCLNGLRGDAEM